MEKREKRGEKGSNEQMGLLLLHALARLMMTCRGFYLFTTLLQGLPF